METDRNINISDVTSGFGEVVHASLYEVFTDVGFSQLTSLTITAHFGSQCFLVSE